MDEGVTIPALARHLGKPTYYVKYIVRKLGIAQRYTLTKRGKLKRAPLARSEVKRILAEHYARTGRQAAY